MLEGKSGLVFSHGSFLDGNDLVLQFSHLFLGQGVELHGDQVADQAQDDDAVSQEDNAQTQLRGSDVTHNRVVIGETAGGKDQTGGHGDNDVAGDALEPALDDGEPQGQDQEVAPADSTGGGVGGHGSGITEQPQGAQRQVGDDAAHGTDDHGLLLAQTGGQQRDGQEGGNAGGDGGQSREYCGDFWYETDFFVPGEWNGCDVAIRFGSATHRARVFVNGVEVTSHEGGFLPFNADIAEIVRYNQYNKLAVLVNNELNEYMLPAGKTAVLSNGKKMAAP